MEIRKRFLINVCSNIYSSFIPAANLNYCNSCSRSMFQIQGTVIKLGPAFVTFSGQRKVNISSITTSFDYRDKICR